MGMHSVHFKITDSNNHVVNDHAVMTIAVNTMNWKLVGERTVMKEGIATALAFLYPPH